VTARRHELTDEEWARLALMLPPEKPRTGRSNNDHRLIVNVSPWHLGPWQSVYTRFRRWRLADVWDRSFAALQRRKTRRGT
jgi:transposase